MSVSMSVSEVTHGTGTPKNDCYIEFSCNTHQYSNRLYLNDIFDISVHVRQSTEGVTLRSGSSRIEVNDSSDRSHPTLI